TSEDSTVSSSVSVFAIVIVAASAIIVSASIYLVVRVLSRRFHRREDVVRSQDSVGTASGGQVRQCGSSPATGGLLDSLPLFTFGSVTGRLSGSGGDCAVCLSKFARHDQLRLLPLCCHAFHAACIDAWIVSNQTCPLCRSSVLPSESDALGKILSNDDESDNGRSFRIEIGSISRRRGGSVVESAEVGRRAFSVGSFEYILDGNGYELSIGSVSPRRGASDGNSIDKESSIDVPIPEPPGDSLAAGVSTSRNWLREYVDRLASVSFSSSAMSFRGSGRFFSGSSRRVDPITAAEDLEANNRRAGEEISELFRWLSGV
ncbi:hypothetical protein M569_15955, partial [Genlisea aurea]